MTKNAACDVHYRIETVSILEFPNVYHPMIIRNFEQSHWMKNTQNLHIHA